MPTADTAVRPQLLVVDDEPDFGALIRNVAQPMGWEVTVTTAPAAFMQAYKRLSPARIMLDVVMPGMDGIELIRWLADRNCQADIIIVTGFNPHYARMAEVLGVSRSLRVMATLPKPVPLQTLREALRLPA